MSNPKDSVSKPEDLLSRYAESYASHVKQATRTWITLAVLSLYCLWIAMSDKLEAKLPLVDATLSREWFAVIATGLLAALLTHWQEVLNRANHLRQGLVQARIQDLEESGIDDAKEVWDALATASTQAVWGIASALARSTSDLQRRIAFPYYVFLKVISFAVHVGLPGVTLLILVRYAKGLGFWGAALLLVPLALTAAFQLLAAIGTELRYLPHALKEMQRIGACSKRTSGEKNGTSLILEEQPGDNQ